MNERTRLAIGNIGWFDVFFTEAEAIEVCNEEIAGGNPHAKWWHAPEDSAVGECWPVWYGPTGRYS